MAAAVKDESERTFWFQLSPHGASNLGARVKSRPNAVRTARYTPLTWLPKSVLHQFRKRANVFFLFVAVSLLSCSCPPRGTAMGVTFSVMMLVQMLMDLVEDLRRRRDDRAENTQRFRRWLPGDAGGWADGQWQDCHVGDVVLIFKDEPLPADILAFATADEGTCYVSTASLDGETNLKHKLAVGALQFDQAASQEPAEFAASLLAAQPLLTLGAPRRGLKDLRGRLTMAGRDWGLGPEHFLLRGSVLRNTAWVLGVVCYVGKDTKVRLDAMPSLAKFSDVHHTLNRFVAGFIVCLSLLCIYLTAASSFAGGLPRLEGPAFLCDTDNLFIVFWRSVLVFYTIFPVTLYLMTQITKELCRRVVDRDRLLRGAEDGLGARMRSCDLVEELGQVHVVFSDKTGTLTANDLRFAFCCLGGLTLGPFLPSPGLGAGSDGFAEATALLTGGGGEGEQAAARALFEAMALCHEVQPDGAGYRGESPDEVALVRAAASAGVALRSRTRRGRGWCLALEAPWGAEQWEVSHVLGFSSERKRMSVVLQRPDGGALVLTKGADVAVKPLLLDGQLPEAAAEANSHFARRGFRTLVFGRRALAPGEFAEWQRAWDEADRAVLGREALLASATAMAERGLEYLGLTVLEDRLQTGASEAVAAVRQAGLGFWVLTGDSVDTAVEVAKACGLFEDGLTVARVVGAASPKQALAQLEGAAAERRPGASHGLVIDGDSVQQALLEDGPRRLLYDLGSAGACVACRLTPAQKKELVELVHWASPRSVTLAIGDGANDAPMIQAARVGVGVRGKEGTAAVQASDVAISEFRFLQRILFFHGRKAYEKVSLFILWYMYKQLLVSWSNIIFAASVRYRLRNCWAGNVEDLMNLLEFLSYAILFRDCPPSDEASSPEWYFPGPQRLLFNFRAAAGWLLLATWHGVLAWSVPVFLLTDSADRQADPPTRRFWEGSITAYTIATLTVYLKLGLEARRYLGLRGAAAIAAIVPLYLVILLVLSLDVPANPFFTPELTGGTAWVMFTSWQHGFCVLLVPCLALVPDLALALRPRAKGLPARLSGVSRILPATAAPLQVKCLPAGPGFDDKSVSATGPTASTPPCANLEASDQVPRAFLCPCPWHRV